VFVRSFVRRRGGSFVCCVAIFGVTVLLVLVSVGDSSRLVSSSGFIVWFIVVWFILAFRQPVSGVLKEKRNVAETSRENK